MGRKGERKAKTNATPRPEPTNISDDVEDAKNMDFDSEKSRKDFQIKHHTRLSRCSSDYSNSLHSSSLV